MAKYSEIMAMQPPSPRLLRKDFAAGYVAGEQNLKVLVQAKWVKPIIQHSGCTAYDRRDLDFALDRAKLEGWPKSISKSPGVK